MTELASYDAEHAEEQRISSWCGWEDVYRAAFPSCTGVERVTDVLMQKAGVDRIVYLGSARVSVHVDEKYDRHRTGNFFLELQSDAERGQEGWLVGKDADFIGYLFRPERAFYLLPYRRLAEQWERRREDWADRYGIKNIPNRSRTGGQYTTTGIAIPRRVVLDAIDGATLVRFAERTWVRTRA